MDILLPTQGSTACDRFGVWSESLQTCSKLPTGVKNIHTVFTYKASADVEVEKPIGRLPEKL
eukprot:2452071-Amphidinium_carterae.1